MGAFISLAASCRQQTSGGRVQHGTISGGKYGNDRRRRQNFDQRLRGPRRLLFRNLPATRREADMRQRDRRAARRRWRHAARRRHRAGRPAAAICVRLAPRGSMRSGCSTCPCPARAPASASRCVLLHSAAKCSALGAAALEAGAMPGGQRGRLVEEEQLGVAVGLHQLPAPALELEQAGDPLPGRPAARLERLVGQMEAAAAVAHHQAAVRRGDDLACRA